MDDIDKYGSEDSRHEMGERLRLFSRRNDSDLHHRSTLTQGIHITDFPESRVNPTPLFLEESDILLEQYLSPGKLQLLAGVDDLKTVETLDLKVDSRETSLGNFGSLLPNLLELNLNGSRISCMRDLGSSLRKLRVLWMARCGLEELDGISALSELRELYLEYNEISDVSPLSMLEHLQVLDLEGNNIDDVTQLQYLSLCPKLRKLAIDGNPICVDPKLAQEQSGYDIRETVRKLLPDLRILDDERLDEESSSCRRNVFDEDWAYLEELQAEALLQNQHSQQQEEATSAGDRPPTAAFQPAAEYRPGSALRPSSGFCSVSSSKRPSTTSGSSTSLVDPVAVSNRPISSDAVDGIESVSDLTMGGVICGNPSKALRQRKQGKVGSKEDIDKKLGKLCQKGVVLSPCDGAGDVSQSPEGAMINIMEELKAWKLEHDKRMELILKSKEAQILIVDHEEDDCDEFNDDLYDDDEDDSSLDDDERNILEYMMNQYDYRPPYLIQENIADFEQKGITPTAKSPEVNSNNIYSETDIENNSMEKSSCIFAAASLREHGRYDQSFDVEGDLSDSKGLHSETSSSHSSISQQYKSQREDLKDLSSQFDRSVHPRSSSRNQSDRSLAPLRVPSPASVQMKNEPHSKPTELSSPRQKKLRVGPTGLPLPSQTQQPVIKNNVAVVQSRSGVVPACRPGLSPSNIVLLPSQPRIQRQLPQPSPLISPPPSNS
ncbi:hypothetical protein BsWGS_07002 [Bradybaena similaris]